MKINKARYLAHYGKQLLTGALTINSSLISSGSRGFMAGVADLLLNLVDRRHLRYCNICGWEGSRFIVNAGSGYFVRHDMCPSCGEIGRYRMLYSLVTPSLSDGMTVLEIGPNRAFGHAIFERFPITYLCSDLSDRRANLRMDLTAMAFADNSFDIVLCMHVLEHIPDDHAAMSELFRILKSSGVLYAQVPMSGEHRTIEYGFFNPHDNWHVRIYGTDFANRLADAGFQVHPVLPHDLFDVAEMERLCVKNEHLPIFKCTKR